MPEQVLESVKSKYGAVAESPLSNDDAGVRAVAQAFGYSEEELRSIPAGANMGLSCGNPVATASIRPGEVIVDLGAGGGLDVFLASRLVGPTGRAIGIDMTQAMIDRAEANALSGGYGNVEFHLAQIDHMPLADASVDCVISNCVINLAPDKAAVFKEIARILKPGGRLAVSDIALKGELPTEVAQSMAAYVGCIAGAIPMDAYRDGLLAAGFEHVQIVDTGADLNAYAKVENQAGCCSPGMAATPDATMGATPYATTDTTTDVRSGAPDVTTDTANPLQVIESACCSPAAGAATTLHGELANLLERYDINAAAASVKVYAVKPGAVKPGAVKPGAVKPGMQA